MRSTTPNIGTNSLQRNLPAKVPVTADRLRLAPNLITLPLSYNCFATFAVWPIIKWLGKLLFESLNLPGLRPAFGAVSGRVRGSKLVRRVRLRVSLRALRRLLHDDHALDYSGHAHELLASQLRAVLRAQQHRRRVRLEYARPSIVRTVRKPHQIISQKNFKKTLNTNSNCVLSNQIKSK